MSGPQLFDANNRPLGQGTPRDFTIGPVTLPNIPDSVDYWKQKTYSSQQLPMSVLLWISVSTALDETKKERDKLRDRLGKLEHELRETKKLLRKVIDR